MVLQDAAGSLNPRQTVYESVAEGIRLHRRVAADADGTSEVELVAAALAEAGLRPPERFFLRYPHELSGGQKQRVLIAGALALRPQLLIADEPVSSLDASIRGEILALLLRLREELGVGIVVVTHDLGLAWNIADRIAVMYLGRVVECGTTEEVLEHPRHPYTRALLSVVPEIERLEPVVLTGEIPDPTRIPAGCRFHPRCPALARRQRGARRGRGEVPHRGRWSRCRPPETTGWRATSTPPCAPTARVDRKRRLAGWSAGGSAPLDTSRRRVEGCPLLTGESVVQRAAGVRSGHGRHPAAGAPTGVVRRPRDLGDRAGRRPARRVVLRG